MEEYIWLLHRKNENGLAVAVTGSLLVHGLLIVLLATTQIFYPRTGENPRLDVVWLYAALLRDQPQESSPPDAAPPEVKEAVSVPRDEEEVEEELPELPPAEADHEEPVVVAPAALPKPRTPSVQTPPTPARRDPPPKVEAIRNEAPVREELKLVEEGKGVLRSPPPVPAKAPEKAPASDKLQEKALVTAKAPAAVASVLKNVTTATAAPRKVVRREPVKAEQVQAAVERPTPKAEPVRVKKGMPVPVKKEAPVPRQENRPAVAAVTREAAAPAPAPRVVSSPRKESQSPAAKKREAIRTPEASSQSALPPSRPAAPSPKSAVPAGEAAIAKAVTLPAAKPVAPSAPKPSVAAAGQKAAAPASAPAKGVFEAPVTGDLKMELIGKNRSLKGAKITVLFRDYPRSRRGKTMVKTEALRRRQIQPRLARPAENTLQAVVESAAEGVYDFRVESESGGPVEAEYVMRFYEKTDKAKGKSLGTRAVGNRARVARVLMPEGVVWEDDAAFSGSMEDSDSITKFNSETGLVWKEYREE